MPNPYKSGGNNPRRYSRPRKARRSWQERRTRKDDAPRTGARLRERDRREREERDEV